MPPTNKLAGRRDEIADALRAGASYGEVAARLGVDKKSIYHHAKRMGIDSQHYANTGTAVVEIRGERLCLNEVAHRYRISSTTLYYRYVAGDRGERPWPTGIGSRKSGANWARAAHAIPWRCRRARSAPRCGANTSGWTDENGGSSNEQPSQHRRPPKQADEGNTRADMQAPCRWRVVAVDLSR